MTIPEDQLTTWATRGADASSEATHKSVRAALDGYSWPTGVRYEPYLQGSYRNSTNIRGDSDVDLVVQLESAFMRDLSALEAAESELYMKSFSDAKYGWREFRADALEALQRYYGSGAVSEGRKCLKVAGASGRLPSDVVVAIQYRRYTRFRSMADQRYAEGMEFYVPSEDRWVVNYPKIHYGNGVKKNSRDVTNGWYKPCVRMFKNARTYLVGRNAIAANLAPSYFLECLLYNVPSAQFGRSYEHTFCNTVNWLETADLSKFVCQNWQQWLFGTTPERWSQEKARSFVQAMIDLWNSWRG